MAKHTYDSRGYETDLHDDAVTARAREAVKAAATRRELEASAVATRSDAASDGRTPAQRADDVRDYEQVKSAEAMKPTPSDPAVTKPDVETQIAMLHLLAEQLRNCAGDTVAVNSVASRLKRAADALSVAIARST